MLTQNGAKALHYDDCGSIEAGKKADIILVDTSDDISLTNRYTRLSNFLYAGTGYAVNTVFVNGNIILQDKKFVSLDQNIILEKCEQLVEKLHRKIVYL
jgi:5-methylthioadenosine/S-adenosylhomocysteine deaminase